MSSLPNMDCTELLVTEEYRKEMMKVLIDEIVTPSKDGKMTQAKMEAALDGESNARHASEDSLSEPEDENDVDNDDDVDPDTKVIVDKVKVLYLAVNFMLKKITVLEAGLRGARKET